MGSTWVLSAPDGPHVGPMNLAIRELTIIWKSSLWTLKSLNIFASKTPHPCGVSLQEPPQHKHTMASLFVTIVPSSIYWSIINEPSDDCEKTSAMLSMLSTNGPSKNSIVWHHYGVYSNHSSVNKCHYHTVASSYIYWSIINEPTDDR